MHIAQIAAQVVNQVPIIGGPPALILQGISYIPEWMLFGAAVVYYNMRT